MMDTVSPPVNALPRASRRTRLVRPWRITFIIFAIALTLGTHWPALQLAAQVPAGDKTIHLLAFGAATVLLWLTGWIKRRWVVVVIVLLWAAVDEVSQGIPILRRWFSWQDMISNVLGVVVAGAWLWALRPVGGEVNRARLRAQRYVFEEIFATPQIWMRAIAIAIVTAAMIAVIVLAFSPEAAQAAILGIAALLLGTMAVVTWQEWRRHLGLAAEHMPCLGCGESLRTAIEHGAALYPGGRAGGSRSIACPQCGEVADVDQWRAHPSPPRRLILRTALPELLLGAGALAIIFGGIALTPIAYAWLIGQQSTRFSAISFARMIGQAPDELVLSIDLAVLLALFAVLVRFYRRGIARFYDQAIICRHCGHDLRGTPTDETGRGTCGECGTPFVRILPRRHGDAEAHEG